MLLNYATIIYNLKDLHTYVDYLNREGVDTSFATGYFERREKLPAVVIPTKYGITHQNIYESYTDPLTIYYTYFSNFTLIPLHAVIAPNNYPEYFL